MEKKPVQARITACEVSNPANRVSPIFKDTMLAPGATPFNSGLSGKYAEAMDATCVPCAPDVVTILNMEP
mgnify:CR=1 FL=1